MVLPLVLLIRQDSGLCSHNLILWNAEGLLQMKKWESILTDSRKYPSSLLFYTKCLDFAILFCKISQKYFEFLQNVTKMEGFFSFFYDLQRKSGNFEMLPVKIPKNFSFYLTVWKKHVIIQTGVGR